MRPWEANKELFRKFTDHMYNRMRKTLDFNVALGIVREVMRSQAAMTWSFCDDAIKELINVGSVR